MSTSPHLASNFTYLQEHDEQLLRLGLLAERKKASIKQAPLPSGAPDWPTLLQMTWEQIDEGARTNRPGFKVIRKLLTDKRFEK